MTANHRLSGGYVLAAWLGTALVLAVSLVLGEGLPVVVLVGAMAFGVTSVYIASNARAQRAES